MNYKSLQLALVAFITLFLTSCEVKELPEANVKPKTTTLKGGLKDYFEVVDKEYKIQAQENTYKNEGMITVEIRRNDKDFDFPTDNLNPFGTIKGEDYHVGFGIELFDESGSPVIVSNPTTGGMMGPYSSDDVMGLIRLAKGESGFIRWNVSGDKIDGLTSFQISSAVEKSTGTVSSSSDESYSEEVSMETPKGSADVDKMLDSYEEYVDQYIAVLKKSQSGDMSAMEDYPALMEKAEEWGQKMQDTQNENNVSPAQMKRMLKIQAKMTNAAADMY